MAKRRRRQRSKQDWAEYRFRPAAWYVKHSAWRFDNPFSHETDYKGWLEVDLDVELIEPVKEVRRGKLEVVSDTVPEQWGHGYFTYYTKEGENERIFSGTVWTSEVGVLGLLVVLLSGRDVQLHAHGEVFKYRKASTTSFGWAVSDHPDLEDM